MFAAQRTSAKHYLESFTGSSATGETLTVINAQTNFNDDSSTPQAFYPYTPTGTIPSTSQFYTMDADFHMQIKLLIGTGNNVDVILRFGLQLLVVDKTELRKEINDDVTANYQASDYGEADYNAYAAALRNAYETLGKPDVTAGEITTKLAALRNARQTLDAYPATYTATVTHKLPAADGFKYTYNGVEYTAAGGYITITESQSFPSSSDVTVSANTFSGYTISGTTTESYSKQRADINKTYTYTAVTSKIYFDYKDTHVIGLDGFETERTVTYGQPYGAFPAPTMDGWNFGGWYESGTSNKITGDTVCEMKNGTLYLQAKWTCNFSGGYGTASEPFLIATMGNLDKIDDTTAYVVNNGNSGTKGKYYKQTADISFSANSAPVLDFGGTYEGDNKRLTIPSSITVSSTTYGSIFGAVNGGTVRNLDVLVQGGFAYTGTTGNSGFFGTLTNSTVDNIHITFQGTTKGTSSGVLANTASGSTITNCSVDVQSGTVAGDAFIGSVTGGTRTNDWVLLTNAMDTVKSATANGTVRVRENATAAMTYANGRYTFTATPNTGWNAQFRTADDTLVIDGATYSPAANETGKVYYVCAVKSVTFQAGAHGTLTGAGTYSLRQGQTVTGLVPSANEGYQFTNWGMSTGLNGTMSDASPYTYTMNTVGGTVTANFSANHYTVQFNKGNVPGTVTLPAAKTYSTEDKVTFSSSSVPTYPGWTFAGWYSQANGKGTKYELNTEYNALSKTDGATVTIYAYWTQNQYTVTFVTNGGSAITPQTKTYGESVTFPTSTKLGYKGLLWYTDAEFTQGGYQAGTDTQIYDNITFYAKWSPITYTIVFNAPGASNVPSAQTTAYDAGEFISPSNYVPVMGGYVFEGWDTVQDGSGTRYNVTDSIPGNLSATDGYVYNLYAQWSKAHYNVTWVLGTADVSGETVYAKIDGSTANPVTEVVFGDRYLVPKGEITLDTKAFKGWYTQPSGGTPVTDATTVTITANTNFYAQWDPAAYIVKYSGNGGSGSIQAQTVTYGEHTFVFADNAFTRDGYSFTGWNTAADGSGITYQPGVTLTDDLTVVNGAEITLYAQWSGNTFKIAYNVGGIGTALMTTNNVVMDGNAVTLRTRTTATKDGATYVFKGWAYTAADEQNLIKAYDSGASFKLTEAELAKCTYDIANNTITMYAIWARQNTVTWNLMGGKLADGTTGTFTSVVTRGDKYVLPTTDPTRARHVFTGWYTTAESNTGAAVTNDTVLNENADQTVYARWVSNGNLTASYTTEYYYEGYAAGDYSAAPTVVTGSGDIETEATASVSAPTGFTFDESAPNVLTGVISEDQGEDANPLVLKVYYKRNHYTVSFNANGGTGTMSAVDYAYGETKDLPDNTITREGYTFAGWGLSADATTARYTDGGSLTMSTANVPLYAVWTVNQYTLTFKNGYGADISSTKVNFGAAISAPADPEREGYTFKGWDKTVPATMPANDLTVTATWTVNQYTLTFANGYGGNISSTKVNFGAGVTAPANPTREGYTFGGWDKNIPATMPANNVTITATWTVNQYTLTFKNGYGADISSTKVNFGAAISAPADPEREGYTFKGWDKTVPATMPASDLTVTATWEVNRYRLTITDGFGGNIVKDDVNFGAAITAPANPVKEGYTFTGWSAEIPATMPARNVTINATWTAHKYTVIFAANGGEGTMKSQTFTYDVKQNLTENAFTKVGCTFAGWNVPGQDALLADKAEVMNLASENGATVTLSAEWDNIIYTITFDLNGGTADPAPAQVSTIYGAEETLPDGTGYTYTSETEIRTFLGWMLDGTQYAGGSTYTMPAENITFTAVWSANYYALDALIAQIDGYRQADTLPANRENDIRYAAGGDYAQLLGSNGMYAWDNFDTAALESALADAKDESHRGLPQSEQAAVDALTAQLQAALGGIALLDADYDVTYACTHRKDSAYDASTRKYYPACETGTKHSYNSVLGVIDGLLNAAEADSLYTAESLAELRLTVYGGNDQTGIVQEVQESGLKKPAQAYLAAYVDRLAAAYHGTPVLKDADYTKINALISTYLPQEKHATLDNLLTYYTEESVQALQQYYAGIDRTYKITRQSILDGKIYNELKQNIDNLVAKPADYSSVYTQILRIPKGESYSYPSGDVTDTAAWTAWTSANAGHISQAVDKEFLDTRYEANTVAVLNDVLDAINWNLDIFNQETVNGASDVTYEKRLKTAIDALVRRTYSATFMMNDGTEKVFYTTLGHYYGDAIQFPVSNPTRNGYVFLGWSSSATENIPVTDSSVITGNMVYYAVWELNAATIRFDLNGAEGTAPDAIQADVGKETALPDVSAYAPEGYIFLGWAADGTATSGVMVYTLTEKADVTLYAVWAPADVKLIAQEGSTTVIDEENKMIYGLEFSVTQAGLLAEYLDVDGNGTIKIVTTSYVGTGTKVQVINNYTGEVDAEYSIVIFGDVDGDGTVTLDDIRAIKGHATGAAEFAEGSAQMLAGDVDGDGIVDMQDATLMKGLISGAYAMDQATRRAI